jgi:hypothetical protein
MWKVVVTLTVACDDKSCWREETFEASNGLAAKEAARVAGWKLNNNRKAFCDQHRERPRRERR